MGGGVFLDVFVRHVVVSTVLVFVGVARGSFTCLTTDQPATRLVTQRRPRSLSLTLPCRLGSPGVGAYDRAVNVDGARMIGRACAARLVGGGRERGRERSKEVGRGEAVRDRPGLDAEA